MTITETRPTRVDTQLLTDLRALRSEFEERGWCQGTAEDDDGRVCLLGGIAFATGVWPVKQPDGFYGSPDYFRYATVRDSLAVSPEFGEVIGSRWNDDPARTVDDLYALIDAAIAAEEARP